ncbi:hypothetical protein NMY22_g16571 [Coprinellus aureogranulatus]|nr:hypothetical protein NMY22_g16571 [Coprinellus aureogranulatus]
MAELQVETSTLPPDESYSLWITANRYWSNESSARVISVEHLAEASKSRQGLTLILLHSTSFHKETWEACLETLFKIVEASSPGRHSPVMLEAWAIESPNHGHSAALNEAALRRPPFSTDFGCEGYARAVHRFLTKGPVPFHQKVLVGIGHSLGANAMLLLQSYRPSLPFKSLVIVEPLVSPGGDELFHPLRTRLVHSSERRRDTWASLEEARLSLPGKARSRKRRDGKREWDERVVNAFLVCIYMRSPLHPSANPESRVQQKHGIRPYAKPADNSVTAKFTLACTKEQEIVMYRDKRGAEAPVEVLDKISSTLPTHLILGEIKDYVPGEVHKVLIGPAPGRRFASITTLPDVGHLVPQEKPDALAGAIANVLRLRQFPLCKL